MLLRCAGSPDVPDPARLTVTAGWGIGRGPARPCPDDAIGATLGSGVVLVLDDTANVTDLLQRIARFFRDESCGQCVPCRVGTVRQEELLGRLARGAPLGSAERELALLDDIGTVARDASICGLGQTAVSAAASAVKLGLIGAARVNGNGREPV